MGYFIESARGLIRPAECNDVGALSSAALTARLGDAAAHALNAHGLGPRRLRDDGTPLHIHAETLQRGTELRAGDPFHIGSRLVGGEGGRLALEHRVFHSDTGQVAATARTDMDGPPAAPATVEPPAAQPGLVTFRGRVGAPECDQMRHMNVQHYVEKGAQAMAQFGAAAGLGMAALADLDAVLHPVRERILFEREVYAGDVLMTHSALRVVDGDTLVVASLLRGAETGAVSARFETVLALWDPQTGAPRPLPAGARDRVAALPAATEADFPLPRPITGPRLTDPPGEAAAKGTRVTCRRSVNTWEVDHAGVAPATFHISCVSDAAMHFFTHMGADHAWREAHDMGSAALDYDIVYRRPLHVGVPVELRTRFLETRNKPFRFGHDIVNVTTGESACTVEVTAVLFDLTRRKSIVLPDDFRARAVALGAIDSR